MSRLNHPEHCDVASRAGRHLLAPAAWHFRHDTPLRLTDYFWGQRDVWISVSTSRILIRSRLVQVPVNFHIIGRGRDGDDGKAVRLPPDKNHRGPMAMPIYRLLQNHVFDPDTVAVMVTALRMPCASYG